MLGDDPFPSVDDVIGVHDDLVADYDLPEGFSRRNASKFIE